MRLKCLWKKCNSQKEKRENSEEKQKETDEKRPRTGASTDEGRATPMDMEPSEEQDHGKETGDTNMRDGEIHSGFSRMTRAPLQRKSLAFNRIDAL